VIVGLRDPLVRIANAPRFAGLPHVDAVTVPGAHALHYSNPQLVAELIETHMAGEPLVTQTGRRSVVGRVSVKGRLNGRLIGASVWLICTDCAPRSPNLRKAPGAATAARAGASRCAG
jgi:hypothetical protein